MQEQTGNVPVERRRAGDPLLTLVVPVFNEEQTAPHFVETVNRVLGATALRFEILFVEDGSTDRTRERLRALAACHRHVSFIAFSRNFGKEAALTAGIDHARGDVVIPIDVDLQDPPEVIPRFVEKWREGYDVVYGARAGRSSDSYLKKFTATWFYRVFNRLSREQLPPDAGDFRLMDRRVVDALKTLPESNRFMKGLFAWVGFRTVGVPFERLARERGSSKWSYWKLWNFALDGLAGFSTIPLRLWLYIGAVVCLLSFAYAAVIVFRVLMFGVDVPGYASLITLVLFFGGVQLLSLGTIGEYLGRLFNEVKRRPLYIVDEVVGLGQRDVSRRPADAGREVKD